MVCRPTANVAMLKEAVVTPPEVLTLTGLPASLPSIWNWTVPVGAPAAGAVMLTVTVNVTLWLEIDGLAEETSTVLVLALLTICGTAVELLAVKFVSPPKKAVMMWLPTAKLGFLELALVGPPLVLTV